MNHTALLSLLSPAKSNYDQIAVARATAMIRRTRRDIRRYVCVIRNNAPELACEHQRLVNTCDLFVAEWFERCIVNVERWRRADFRQSLSDARKQLVRLVELPQAKMSLEAVESAEKSLAELERQLELGTVRLKRWATFRHYAFVAIGTLLLTGSAIAAFYLGIQRGLEPESTQVLLPQTIVQDRHAEPISTAPIDLLGYFDQFSDYYFGLSSTFPAHLNDRPPIEKYQDSAPTKRPEGGFPEAEDAAPAPSAPTADPSAFHGPEATYVAQQTQVETKQSARGSTHHQLWRVVFRNKSPYRSQFIGTVTVDLELTKHMRFPWALLRDTPDIFVEFLTPGTFEISNYGIGPAVDIAWQLRTRDGLVLRDGAVDMVYQTAHTETYLHPNFLEPIAEVNSWPIHVRDSDSETGDDVPVREGSTPDEGSTDEREPVVNGDDNPPATTSLARPLFLRLDATPVDGINDGSEHTFTHEGVVYEEITELERLADLTKTIYREPAILSVKYLSVSRVPFERHVSHDLDSCVVYYVRRADLLERDPRIAEQITVEYTVTKHVRTATWRLAQALALPEIQPKGVDLLVRAIELDAVELQIGAVTSQNIDINQFLNASGQLVVYLLITDPANARYQASISTDGTETHSFAFDAFAPPRLQFPAYELEQLQDVKWLSAEIDGATH